MAAAGNRVAAESAVEAVLLRHPFHVGALNLRGTLKAQRGDFLGAAQAFSLAVSEAPGEPASLFNLAQALDRLGRNSEAQALYRRTLEVEPTHPHARARLAASREKPPG